MKTTKTFFILTLLGVLSCLTFQASAQVTIGMEKEPNTNAVLELDTEEQDKGLLLPRVSLTSTTSVSPMTGTIADGMFVYNTNTENDVTPGIYYYEDGKWIRANATGGTTTFNVETVNTTSFYQIKKDTDIVRVTLAGTSAQLGLPTDSDIPVGKMLYIILNHESGVYFRDSDGVQSTALLGRLSYELYQGMSASLIYAGDGLWAILTDGGAF